MNSQKLNRKTFWIWIGVLLVAKVLIGTVVATQFEAGSGSSDGSFLRSLDTGVAIGIAFAVGGRFRDAGWPGWLGIVLTLLIMMVLPVVALFVVMPKGDAALGDLFGTVGIVSTVLLLALIGVAGSRPSVAG